VIRTTWLVKLKSFEVERSADDDAWAMIAVSEDPKVVVRWLINLSAKLMETIWSLSHSMYIV
jgi:hypothetical protein